MIDNSGCRSRRRFRRRTLRAVIGPGLIAASWLGATQASAQDLEIIARAGVCSPLPAEYVQEQLRKLD